MKVESPVVKKTLILFFTLIACSAAWYVSSVKKAQTEIAKTILYPGLMEQLDQLKKITVSSLNDSITIKKTENGWVLEEKDNFPADSTPVRKILLQMAKLSTLEQKTASVGGHAVLGVNNLTENGITRHRIILTSVKGKSFADLMVGKSTSDKNKSRRYIRKIDNEQSWVAEGDLEFSAIAVHWLDPKILDIPPEAVKSIVITDFKSEPVVVTKETASETFFVLQNVPKGYLPKSKTLISSFGSILVDLRLNDVLATKRIENLTAMREMKITTFDGVQITLSDYMIGKKVFTSFRFNRTSLLENNPIRIESDKLKGYEESTKDWVYCLPKYKRRIIERKFENMIKQVKN